MAYNAPSTRSTGELCTAVIWNADVVANEIAIYAGGLSIASQAANDILYATSTTQLGRLAAGTSGYFLKTLGAGSAPVWAAATSVPTLVAFPATQVESADANTLDDYEEGSWTPLIGGVSGQSGQSYNVQIGKYLKVGKILYGSYYIAFASKGTIVGNLQIKGLPFTVVTPHGGSTFGYWAVGTNIQGIQGNMAAVGIYMFKLTTAGATPVAMTTSDISDGTTIIGSFVTSV